jgi:nucleotide-binding universal stress UspA family protein
VFERILLAMDGSAASNHAKEAAAAVAKDNDREIFVLHIREVDVARSGEHDDQEGPDQAVKFVEDVVADLRARGVRASGQASSTTAGRTAPSIILAAKDFHADLIVMGSRGLSDFEALLVGSVAHKVIHHADCAVLVTKQSQ